MEAGLAVGTRRALHDDGVFVKEEEEDGHEPGHQDPPNENENDPEVSSWMSDAAQQEQEEEGLSLVSYVVLAVVVNVTVCGVCFVLGWYQDRQIMQRYKLGRLLWNPSPPHATPPAEEAEASTVATNEDNDDHFDSPDRMPRYCIPIIIITAPTHHAKDPDTYDAEALHHHPQKSTWNEEKNNEDPPRMMPSYSQSQQQQQPERRCEHEHHEDRPFRRNIEQVPDEDDDEHNEHEITRTTTKQ